MLTTATADIQASPIGTSTILVPSIPTTARTTATAQARTIVTATTSQHVARQPRSLTVVRAIHRYTLVFGARHHTFFTNQMIFEAALHITQLLVPLSRHTMKLARPPRLVLSPSRVSRQSPFRTPALAAHPLPTTSPIIFLTNDI